MANQNRRPAGSPRSSGGQYAAGRQAESGLDLGGGVATAVPVAGIDPDLAAEVFRATGEAASFADRRVGLSRRLADVDAEDLRQDALLQWWSDRARGHRIDCDSGYARTVARFQAAKLGDRMRAEDRRANKMLHAWQDQFVQRHGRLPTRAEVDEQAASVLCRWPDRRHLPAPDCHKRDLLGGEVSWNAFLNAEGESMLESLATNGQNSSVHGLRRPGCLALVDETRPATSVSAGSWQSAALSLAEGNHREDKVQLVAARRISCAALAESRRAPMPQVGRLTHAAAASANTRLQRYPGGVTGAIATWRSGETDGGTEALFAPFGSGLDEGDRDDVCDLLELGGNAKTLWNSAAWIADEHNTDAVRRIVARAS
jgi:hypothetical protein